MREDLEKATQVGGFVGLRKALTAGEAELGAHETVNAAGAGNLNGKPCVVIATPNRVLFVSTGVFGRVSTSSVALPVSEVEHGRGKLTLRTPGGDRTFRVVSGGKALEQAILNPAGGRVETWIEASKGQTGEGAGHPLAVKPLDELAGLLDRGEISGEEYAERRARILAKINR